LRGDRSVLGCCPRECLVHCGWCISSFLHCYFGGVGFGWGLRGMGSVPTIRLKRRTTGIRELATKESGDADGKTWTEGMEAGLKVRNWVWEREMKERKTNKTNKRTREQKSKNKQKERNKEQQR
jgi:hypothetical protein